MALVKCRDCGNQVSTNAKACPKCGCAPRKPRGLFDKIVLWTLAGGFGLAIASAVIGSFMASAENERKAADAIIAERGLRAAMTAEEYAQYTEKNKLDADSVVATEKAKQAKIDSQLRVLMLAESDVKRILNDPESAKFGKKNFYENASSSTGMTICGYVNAKNSFGAYTGNKGYMVIDRQPSIESQGDSFAREWNRLCR
jgi:hypothetical protein